MINFVKKDKNKYIQLVEPNFIKNRFDIMFDDKYELIEIKEGLTTYYIPLHIDDDKIYLGLYLSNIPQSIFDKMINVIFNYYKEINYIEVNQTQNNNKDLKEENNYVIELPKTEDDYLNNLGKKTRQHLRQYYRNVQKDFNVDLKVFDRDIPSSIISKYFKFKKENIGKKYKETEQEYIQEYNVTKAIVLYLNNEISAISFISEVDNKEVYYENFSYDKQYANYSLGTLITYLTIKYLIENNYKTFYLGTGDYLYKKNLATNVYTTYKGIIKRKLKNKNYIKEIINNIISYKKRDNFNYLTICGLKIKKRIIRRNCKLEINKDTKCLMVAPHPDDEILGAGALMIKYSNNFDCICIGSSGLSHGKGIEEGKKNSQIRINEFKNVMNYIGIKNHWIFETYGEPRFDNQMINNFNNYCSVLDLKQYDYIFLPHPKDGHHEHRFITNKLFKKIINKIGYNPNTKIVFYEVWADMKKPNVFFDTSKDGFLYSKNGFKKYQPANSKLLGTTEDTLLDWKYKILEMYKSQWKDESPFIIQTMRTKCLSNGQNPIWRFRVVNIKEYV